MQQPEAAVGQTALRGNPASQMTSRNQKFETLGEAVMDALKEGGKIGGFIKTGIVFDSEEEALLPVHISGERGGDAVFIR